MQEIIIVCYVELGQAFQTVHIVLPEATKTLRNIQTEELPRAIVDLCDGFETEQVELFGPEDYIKGIKYDLILKKKNLKVGVNRHEIFN
mgnify:CR=1 FL=1